MTFVAVALVLVLAIVLLVWGLWPRKNAPVPVIEEPLEWRNVSKPLTPAEKRQSAEAASVYLERMQANAPAFRGTVGEGSSTLRNYKPGYGVGDAGRL